ncbi:hypothetical protein ACJX0J_010170, partial [Zea mays]
MTLIENNKRKINYLDHEHFPLLLGEGSIADACLFLVDAGLCVLGDSAAKVELLAVFYLFLDTQVWIDPMTQKHVGLTSLILTLFL